MSAENLWRILAGAEKPDIANQPNSPLPDTSPTLSPPEGSHYPK